ncbi:MAG: hypothetical protein WC389_20090, partial [Lutibacter sp.]
DKITFNEHEIRNEKEILELKQQINSNYQQLYILLKDLSKEQKDNFTLLILEQNNLNRQLNDVVLKLKFDK